MVQARAFARDWFNSTAPLLVSESSNLRFYGLQGPNGLNFGALLGLQRVLPRLPSKKWRHLPGQNSRRCVRSRPFRSPSDCSQQMSCSSYLKFAMQRRPLRGQNLPFSNRSVEVEMLVRLGEYILSAFRRTSRRTHRGGMNRTSQFRLFLAPRTRGRFQEVPSGNRTSDMAA